MVHVLRQLATCNLQEYHWRLSKASNGARHVQVRAIVDDRNKCDYLTLGETCILRSYALMCYSNKTAERACPDIFDLLFLT